MRRYFLCFVALVLATSWSPTRAEDVPGVPAPPPNPAELTPDNLVGPGDLADGPSDTVDKSCDDLTTLVLDDPSRAECAASVKPTNKCYAVAIKPNLSTQGTDVSWRPQINADCYVRRGTTIVAHTQFRVVS